MPKGRNKSYQEPSMSKRLGGAKGGMAAGAALMPVQPVIGSAVILGSAVAGAQGDKAKRPTKAKGVKTRMHKVYKSERNLP